MALDCNADCCRSGWTCTNASELAQALVSQLEYLGDLLKMLAGPVHVHHAPALLQQTADCRFKVAECHYIRKTGHMATVCCSRAKQPGPRDPTRFYHIKNYD